MTVAQIARVDISIGLPPAPAGAARQALSNSANRIAIVGKASLTGYDEHNMDLSRRRADTVKNEMIAAGVPASKIDVNWVCDHQPDVSETAGVEEPRNRVVEGRFE